MIIPKRIFIYRREFILWTFILSNHIYESFATKGCITILKEPKHKNCICTNYETEFTRIPDKFPDYVAELIIENQKIDIIDSSQLQNLPYLANFTFNNNKLSRVVPNSFTNVPQLISLKLAGNNLFLKDSSLPSSSLISLNALKVLDLSRNPLGFVPDYYFQSLKQLNVLILSNAEKGFFIEENGFYGMSNLQVLDLSFNHLTTLAESLSHSFSSMQLQEFYLYKNPWNCDCNLQWLKTWFSRFKTVKFSRDLKKEMKVVNNVDRSTDIQPQCNEPSIVHGKNLLSNSNDAGDFKCAPRIFTKDRNVNIDRGKNLTLSCDLHANPGGDVVWSKNGMVVQKHWQRIRWSKSPGIKFKAWLNIYDVEEGDSGNWRCILTTIAGKVSSTFTVKVIASPSIFDYKFILKYVGIGAITIILLLVIIGIIIYCIYGFQLQNPSRRRKSLSQDKVVLKTEIGGNYTGKNYRIITRTNETVPLDDHLLNSHYYNPTFIANTASVAEQTPSPFSRYLVNGSTTVCPLHGEINTKNTNHSTMSFVDCSSTHHHSRPCPIHGDVLSYLSTTASSTSPSNSIISPDCYNKPDLQSSIYSKCADEYILRVSSCNPTTIMTTGSQLDDIKYSTSVPETSAFSFSAAI